MGELGIRRKRAGDMRAEVVGHAGRLRLNRHSAPSPLEELESLHARINGKLDMWNALRSSLGARVDGIDFDELARRTERQAEVLERRRLDVAATALTHGAVALTPRPARERLSLHAALPQPDRKATPA